MRVSPAEMSHPVNKLTLALDVLTSRYRQEQGQLANTTGILYSGCRPCFSTHTTHTLAPMRNTADQLQQSYQQMKATTSYGMKAPYCSASEKPYQEIQWNIVYPVTNRPQKSGGINGVVTEI